MHAGNRQRTRRRLPGTSGLAVILAVGFSVSLMSASRRTLPAVGDIIVFKGGEAPPRGRELRIAVHRPGQYGCILSIGTLHQTGGSLIVEARLAQPAPAFRLHWAGARTSADSGDCGRSADMIIAPDDLESLVREASGYGTRS
ncbi:MAG: hypothetical protein ACJ8AW_36960 [Rhodopila sp.]|jgi:hypothetical protein